MKKALLLASLISIPFFGKTQGLENIIVETYYVSDANDATVNDLGGVLPIGSVTRRIYVDMLPGYKLQAIYGVPLHELRIATTTLFFNNEDRGAIHPTYSKNQAKDNTVMLDSWLSVGAGCAGNFGVLKTADDGVLNNANNDGVLSNDTPQIGIPLTTQDGLLSVVGVTPVSVTTVGGNDQWSIFDAQNDGSNGPVFSTFDGSWAALVGASGPNPETNQVLIAQITTDGVLTFELNIQIGTPDGGVERYVASNPSSNEILFPELTYNSELITSTENPSDISEKLITYPNPVSDNLQISSGFKQGSICRYSIYSMRGDRLWVQTLVNTNNLNSIDVSELSSGLYILECISDGKRSSQRFVKN
jgi:hypothetical protein